MRNGTVLPETANVGWPTPRKLRQPTTREIIAELRRPGAPIERCRTPRGLAKPAELWLRDIDTWLRADGFCGTFALRGHRVFGRVAAGRIRRAVQAWERR